MLKTALTLFVSITLLSGCGSRVQRQADASATESTIPSAAASAAPTATPASSAAAEPATAPPSEPPVINVGLSVEQAYAAIPHRRTVWVESDSTVPAGEKAYLRVIFNVIDQAVAVRVAGLQNFSAQQFDGSDPVGNYDRLIEFVRGMTVPKALAAYHQHVLDGLAGQRQFFEDWKSEREQFRFARDIGGHAGARKASVALRAAYNDLVAKYPNENATNKDAFFDYHCALDFL